MRILLLSLFITASFLGLSIEKTYDVDPFTEIKANGHVNVKVVLGEKNKVVVISDIELDKFKVEVKKGELQVGTIDGKYKDAVPEVTVYLKEVYSIRAFGHAEIEFLENYEVEKIEFEAQAGGHLHIKCRANKIEATISQGGRITLSGKTEFLETTVNTGGVIAGFGISSNNVVARIKAGGEIFVHPKTFLDAKVIAGGTITYKGAPETLKSKTTAGGKIIKFGSK